MNFIKRNVILFCIICLGIYLRFNIELFIPGYCFDEIAMASVAKQSFPFGILKQAALLDYHAPLYYFIVHFFTKLPQEWLFLRFFNLILSIVNIIIFYLIGKEINNKSTGLVLALFFSINHLIISTVSFVKFYCLCFLLVSISILFFIKSQKKPKYLIHLGIINSCYIYSATLGFVFVFLQYIILFLDKKLNKKQIVISFLIALMGFLAYLPVLIIQTNFALNNLISPHGAYAGAYFCEIIGIFNDYISPLVNYCCNYNTINANEIFYIFAKELMQHSFDKILFAILIAFSLIPITIGLFLNIKAIKLNEITKKITNLGYSFLIIYLILIKFQIMGLVTIYFYPFGLIFIILLVCGAVNTKEKFLKYPMVIYLILIQLIISNIFPISQRSADKDKIYYCIEQYFKENGQNDDRLYIMTNGARFLEKYYSDKKIIPFDSEQIAGCHDRKFIELLFGNEVAKNANKYNLLDKIKPIIQENKRNTDFENYVIENVINKLKKGQKLTVAFNCDISPFLLSDENINKILNAKNYKPTLLNTTDIIKQNAEYENINIMNIFDVIKTFGYKYLFEILDKNLTISKIEQYSMTKGFIYKKNYESNTISKGSVWLAQHANKGWVFITYTKD